MAKAPFLIKVYFVTLVLIAVMLGAISYFLIPYIKEDLLTRGLNKTYQTHMAERTAEEANFNRLRSDAKNIESKLAEETSSEKKVDLYKQLISGTEGLIVQIDEILTIDRELISIKFDEETRVAAETLLNNDNAIKSSLYGELENLRKQEGYNNYVITSNKTEACFSAAKEKDPINNCLNGAFAEQKNVFHALPYITAELTPNTEKYFTSITEYWQIAINLQDAIATKDSARSEQLVKDLEAANLRKQTLEADSQNEIKKIVFAD